MGNQHIYTFPQRCPILVNRQNRFLLLPYSGTGFSNYDVVSMLGKGHKPKSGLVLMLGLCSVME